MEGHFMQKKFSAAHRPSAVGEELTMDFADGHR
jgi:hypothetical protein